MQRITVEKNEAVADLVERILEAEDQNLLLVVPKGSRLVDSENNFRLIAREAEFLSKEITIESVDDKVLAGAEAAGLGFNHPLFGKKTKGTGAAVAEVAGVPDIVAKDSRGGKKLKVKDIDEGEPEEEPEVDEEDEEPEADEGSEEEEAYDPRSREEDEVEEKFDTLEPRRGKGRKVLAWAITAAVVIVLGMWLVSSAFGRATVAITFQEEPWEYSGTVTADVAANNVDPSTATIPAELAEPQETLTGSFPATGRTEGGQKAHALITVVNDFGPEPQELVATTRFLTPDGKLFRLDNGIVVPGAAVDAQGNVTQPGTIKAAASADKSGPEYNVGPVQRLSIPGFQGTDKYEGFYGVLEEGASGGTNTGGPTPSEEDIAAAQSQMQSRLNDSFQSTFLTALPEDFVVLPQAVSQATTTFNVNRAVDEQGNFNVVARTAFQAFEFREPDLAAMLNGRVQEGDPGKEVQDLELEYLDISPDFSGKRMTFTLNAAGVVAPQFNPSVFAAEVAGKNRDDARAAILALPDLSDATISIWPAWRRSLPSDPEKITVEVL